MDLKELLATTPETLAEKQLEALRQAVLERLHQMAECIRTSDWQMAGRLLFSSPAGDCMGCDNTCISFSHILGYRDDGGCHADIGDMLDRMEKLDKIISDKLVGDIVRGIKRT